MRITSTVSCACPEHHVALAGPTREPPDLGFSSHSRADCLVCVGQPPSPNEEHQLVPAVVFPESHAAGGDDFFLQKPLAVTGVEPVPAHHSPKPQAQAVFVSKPRGG